MTRDGHQDAAAIAGLSLDMLEHEIAQTDTGRRFVAIWRKLCQGALAPPAAGFNPMRFGRTLAWISLLDVAPDLSRVGYRIAARELEQTLGFSLKGMDALALVEPEHRLTRAWRYGQMIGRPCGIYARQAIVSRHGLVVSGEAISLPLASQPGQPGLILLCGVPLAEGGAVATYAGPAVALAREMSFIDLGAGVPGRDDPPPGWTGPDTV